MFDSLNVENSFENDCGSDNELARYLCSWLNVDTPNLGYRDVEAEVDPRDLPDMPQLDHIWDEVPNVEHEEEFAGEDNVGCKDYDTNETPKKKNGKQSISHESITNRDAVFV